MILRPIEMVGIYELVDEWERCCNSAMSPEWHKEFWAPDRSWAQERTDQLSASNGNGAFYLCTGHPLGSGHFGQVFVANALGMVDFKPRGRKTRYRLGWHGRAYLNNNHITKVAVKRLKGDVSVVRYEYKKNDPSSNGDGNPDPFTPRVINFKFFLQPNQKYYITQYEELGFS